MSIFFHANAQVIKYVSPGISLGYGLTTKGISLGFECDFGLIKSTINNRPVNFGLTYGRYFTSVKKFKTNEIHWHSVYDVMLEGENFDLKTGLGKAKYTHGYRGAVRCRVAGWNTDFSYTTPSYQMPWFGIKSFYYPRPKWRFFSSYYHTFYTKYKYDFHNSGLKR
ncbi:MAG: hypothetical protein H6607_11030 [Flavobacteriales bacterium]|nr:hypothetical protein [Flavobacteriales bacterium]